MSDNPCRTICLSFVAKQWRYDPLANQTRTLAASDKRRAGPLALCEAGREVGEAGLLEAAGKGDVALCTLFLDAGVPIDRDCSRYPQQMRGAGSAPPQGPHLGHIARTRPQVAVPGRSKRWASVG